ncbi:MAG: preprotein translocase subunit SecE [Patescibacteria group bacterium]
MDQPVPTSIQPRVTIRTLPSYFKTSWQELKKVSWPTRKETWRNTWVVILVSVFFGLFLGALDYALNRLLEYILSYA